MMRPRSSARAWTGAAYSVRLPDGRKITAKGANHGARATAIIEQRDGFWVLREVVPEGKVPEWVKTNATLQAVVALRF